MNTPAQMKPELKSAYQIALSGIVGTALTSAFYLFLAIQNPTWQLFALSADTLSLLVVSIFSASIVRRGNAARGMVLLIGAAQIVFAVAPALVTGVGLAFALGITFVTAIIATETLPSRQIVITAITAAMSGIISIILDALSPAYRLPSPRLLEIFVPILMVGVTLTVGYFLIQQFRQSLRARLLLGFTIIVLVAGAFGAFAIQQQYLNTEKAAITDATSLVETIALSVGRYQASAQDFVGQLGRGQQHNVIIVDTQKRVLASTNNADTFTVYTSDLGNEVSATMKDGTVRTFQATRSGDPRTFNMIVAPMYDASGKISGAAIMDYTSLLGQLQSATNVVSTQQLIDLGAIGLMLMFAGIQFIASQIADPIILLRDAATAVGSGQLDTPIPDRPLDDEIGTLTRSFKDMTTQLRNLIGNLEERVQERTAELDTANKESQRRASQLEAISKVSESIAGIHDIETILPEITQTISKQFGFYHVGIFLLDETGESAVLHAANSEGGQRMLKRGHRLAVGEQGIVGYAAGSASPRIALDTGADAVYFDNPDLPTTRSEMALPLVIEQHVIGVLDVQSEESSAFTQEDINVLSTLANQVSIAIQNARLFEETSRSLREARALYEQRIQSALSQSVQEKRVGYRLTGTHLTSLTTPTESPEIKAAYSQGSKVIKSANHESDSAVLTIPIKLRDMVIGVLDIRSQNSAGWDQDDIDIAEAIAARVALSVENAALLEDSQRRAEIERLTSEITGKIGATTQFDSILRTAAEELSKVLDGSDVLVQIQSITENNHRERNGSMSRAK